MKEKECNKKGRGSKIWREAIKGKLKLDKSKESQSNPIFLNFEKIYVSRKVRIVRSVIFWLQNLTNSWRLAYNKCMISLVWKTKKIRNSETNLDTFLNKIIAFKIPKSSTSNPILKSIHSRIHTNMIFTVSWESKKSKKKTISDITLKSRPTKETRK